MKYALLGYDSEGSLDALAPEEKRSLHREHRAMHHEAAAANNPAVNVIAHYRFRPSPLAIIRRGAEPGVGTANRDEAAARERSARLRALYILDSDDPDAVVQLAEQLPATLHGATIEIWPLTEPRASH